MSVKTLLSTIRLVFVPITRLLAVYKLQNQRSGASWPDNKNLNVDEAIRGNFNIERKQRGSKGRRQRELRSSRVLVDNKFLELSEISIG